MHPISDEIRAKLAKPTKASYLLTKKEEVAPEVFKLTITAPEGHTFAHKVTHIQYASVLIYLQLSQSI